MHVPGDAIRRLRFGLGGQRGAQCKGSNFAGGNCLFYSPGTFPTATPPSECRDSAGCGAGTWDCLLGIKQRARSSFTELCCANKLLLAACCAQTPSRAAPSSPHPHFLHPLINPGKSQAGVVSISINQLLPDNLRRFKHQYPKRQCEGWCRLVRLSLSILVPLHHSIAMVTGE